MSEEKTQEELKPSTEEAPVGEQEELKQEDSPALENEVINHKAELERLKAERDNYKEGLLNAKDMLKKSEQKEEVDEETISEKVSKMVEERIDGLKNDINVGVVETILETISSNDDEKELIKFHYENSIKKSGVSATQIRSDLENAKLMANKAKLINENEELKRSLIAKNSMTSGAGSNIDKPSSVQDVKLSPTEKRLFDRFNRRRTTRGDKLMTEQEFMAEVLKNKN